MKWAKLTKDADLKKMTLEDKKSSFKLYDKIKRPTAPLGTKKTGSNLLEGTLPSFQSSQKAAKKDKFGVWKSYQLQVKLGRTAQKRYEIFCGGWLLFYDNIVRNKKTDHTMFFEWDNKSNKLKIWITPFAKNNPKKNYIKYLPMALDPPNPPPPPPPPRNS